MKQSAEDAEWRSIRQLISNHRAALLELIRQVSAVQLIKSNILQVSCPPRKLKSRSTQKPLSNTRNLGHGKGLRMHTRATGEDVKRGRVVLAQAHAARDEAHPALGESGSSILRKSPLRRTWLSAQTRILRADRTISHEVLPLTFLTQSAHRGRSIERNCPEMRAPAPLSGC